MPLPREIIKAYVADTVVRCAFNPPSDSEKRRWLHLLHRSVPTFWGVENFPNLPHQDGRVLRGKLEHGQLQFLVEYQVEANANIGAKIMLCRDNDRDLLWHHHCDNHYFRFPERMTLEKIGEERAALRAAKPADMEAVVDGLI